MMPLLRTERDTPSTVALERQRILSGRDVRRALALLPWRANGEQDKLLREAAAVCVVEQDRVKAGWLGTGHRRRSGRGLPLHTIRPAAQVETRRFAHAGAGEGARLIRWPTRYDGLMLPPVGTANHGECNQNGDGDSFHAVNTTAPTLRNYEQTAYNAVEMWLRNE
jgi:hypothetical protein